MTWKNWAPKIEPSDLSNDVKTFSDVTEGIFRSLVLYLDRIKRYVHASSLWFLANWRYIFITAHSEYFCGFA